MSNFPFNETRYGFDWGPLKIERVFSHPKHGVVVRIGSEHQQFEVRVSPKGQNVNVNEADGVHWSRGD